VFFEGAVLRLKYAIIGTGACGGAIGGCLLQSGCDVSFLARSDYDDIHTNGLKVTNEALLEQMSHRVAVYKTMTDMPVCDVVILAVKSYANQEILFSLKSILNPSSVIIILQNGLDIEKEIGRLYPDITQVATVSWIKVARNSPGTYQHVFGSEINAINYVHSRNEYSNTPTAANEIIIADFAKAGFKLNYSHPFFERQWTKLALNIPLSILSITHNLSSREILSNEGCSEELASLRQEIGAVAEASCGAHIDYDYINSVCRQLREAALSTYPSMKIDYDNHRELELGTIFLPVVKKAQQYTLDTPNLISGYKLLQEMSMPQCSANMTIDDGRKPSIKK
jgi:2-dehydropantoate 2-reductase